MVRKAISSRIKSKGFRFRGEGGTRIEALSDGVFAIAIALLLISSDIPETFRELQEFMYDFVPFGATIAILMVIWYQHYLFFLRYGLQDIKTVTINTVLLFLILFYVYPLKFLFRTLYQLFSYLLTDNGEGMNELFTNVVPRGDGPTLMVIYGSGGVLIFLTLAGLYWRALKVKSELELDDLEVYDTKASIRLNMTQSLIALLSVAIAGFRIGGDWSFMVSGMTYWLYPIVMPIVGSRVASRRKKLFGTIKGDAD